MKSRRCGASEALVALDVRWLVAIGAVVNPLAARGVTSDPDFRGSSTVAVSPCTVGETPMQ